MRQVRRLWCYSLSMQATWLTKIRLTYFFVILLAVFFIIAAIIPGQKFDAAALTLFSVNSFLYGFYISPILGVQKSRTEELHKIVRTEANAIFAIMLLVKKLPTTLRHEVKSKVELYLQNTVEGKFKAGEKAYESLITLCLEYKGKDADVEKLLDKLVANQQNRTMFTMHLQNRVYSNEWLIMTILFFITLSFILALDTGENIIYQFVVALLCAGLSMLLLILLKLSTLTHKKARQMWQPFKTLLKTRFYQIDQS